MPTQMPGQAAGHRPTSRGWRPAIANALRETAARLDGNLRDMGARTAIEVARVRPLEADRVFTCAQALLNTGQLDAAEHLFSALATAFPASLASLLGLAKIAVRRQDWPQAVTRWDAIFQQRGADVKPLWVSEQATALTGAGRPEDAFDLLDAHGLIASMPPALHIFGLRRLLRCQRLADARMIFVAALARVEDPADLAALLDMVARLFEGWQRTEFFLALLRKTDRLAPSNGDTEFATVAAVKLRLLLALRDYNGFRRVFKLVTDPSRLGRHEAGLCAVAARLADTPFPDRTRLKVFGIGLSRTGTTSLAAALTQLGLFTLHWANRLTGEMLSDSDLPLFDAFVDTPACLDFERNYYLYPNSKFIYTVRPRSDWLRSWSAYAQQRWQLSSHDDFAEALNRPDQFEFGTQFVELHLALYYNYESDECALDVYERRVRNFFADKPAERFLQLDVFAGDGWPEICAFLQRDPPNCPFPWENRGPESARSASAGSDAAGKRQHLA